MGVRTCVTGVLWENRNGSGVIGGGFGPLSLGGVGWDAMAVKNVAVREESKYLEGNKAVFWWQVLWPELSFDGKIIEKGNDVVRHAKHRRRR